MTTLKEAYKSYFKIGAAVSRRTIKTHEELLKQHFNSLTCENEMKFGSLYTLEGEEKYSTADEMYAIAQELGIGMRGHTLVWHNQTPGFVFEGENPEKTMARLEEHMKKMAARYDKGIYAWDVVNEAIEDKEDTYLRKTKWLDILGEDYMAEVFKMAGRIFGGKDLYYNDYNETNPIKRAKIYKLVKDLKERGLPITGVGMQAHYNIYSPSIDQIKESVELYASLGVKISVTEMDVSLFRFDDKAGLPAPTAELIKLQADYYKECFKIFRSYHEHVDSVTLWGVADDGTWLDHFPVRNRKNWPLLFDEKHNPKEAFFSVMDF